jgi:hypothetical protein
MSDLVTVTAYTADDDARTAKGALDSAGIESALDMALDRAMARRVKVRVHNVDALRAGDVLNARCPALAEIDEADEEELELVCPACGSRDVKSSPRGRTFAAVAFIALLIGVSAHFLQPAFFAILAAAVFFLVADRWRCENCDETWD